MQEQAMEEDHVSWIKITTNVSLFYVRQRKVGSYTNLTSAFY